MTQISKLARRCEKVSGPNRELGFEILLACGWRKTSVGNFYGPLYYWSDGGSISLPEDRLSCPTKSIDAALGLLPPTACNHDLFSFGGGGRTDLPKGGFCWGFKFHDTAQLVGIERAKADVARLLKDAPGGFTIAGEPKLKFERAIAEQFMEFSSTHTANAALAICAAALRCRSPEHSRPPSNSEAK